MNTKFDLEHGFNIDDKFYIVVDNNVKECLVIDKEYPCIDQVLGPYYLDESNGPQMATTNIYNYDKCKLSYSCDDHEYIVILFKDGSFEDHVINYLDNIELISNDKKECIDYVKELIDSDIKKLQENIKDLKKQKENLKF